MDIFKSDITSEIAKINKFNQLHSAVVNLECLIHIKQEVIYSASET